MNAIRGGRRDPHLLLEPPGRAYRSVKADGGAGTRSARADMARSGDLPRRCEPSHGAPMSMHDRLPSRHDFIVCAAGTDDISFSARAYVAPRGGVSHVHDPAIVQRPGRVRTTPALALIVAPDPAAATPIAQST